MKQNIQQSAKTIILALVIGLGITYVSAWSGPPSGNPPECPSGYTGCDAPIHVGANAQGKVGGLAVGKLSGPTGDAIFEANGKILGLGLAVLGDSYISGKVGIGIPSSPNGLGPVEKVEVAGKIKANDFCLTDNSKCLSGNTSGGGVSTDTNGPVYISPTTLDISVGSWRTVNLSSVGIPSDATSVLIQYSGTAQADGGSGPGAPMRVDFIVQARKNSSSPVYTLTNNAISQSANIGISGQGISPVGNGSFDIRVNGVESIIPLAASVIGYYR